MVQPKSDVPLSEPTLLILAALWREPLHGYGIRQAVLGLSQGRVELGNGTLYECIRRLEGRGWIEEVSRVPRTKRPCRPFALTEPGRVLLRSEAARIRELCNLCRGLGILEDDSDEPPRARGT
jgi:DNA-binding PadR family transcriptional regulator